MLIIPAILESFRSLKDRTLKLVFETNELNPGQMASIQESLLKAGYLAFNPEPFSASQEKFLTEVESDYNDPGKSPSKRLRGVLYRCWEKDKEGYEDFTRYYDFHIERVIVFYKKKLD